MDKELTQHYFIGSDSTFRDGFLEGAARAFFVMAYSEFAEEHNDLDLSRPGPGQDWYDFTPEETPPNAYALAGQMWEALEWANKCSLYQLAAMAETADGQPVDPEEFGRCLAMQYMGTGVSWFDDHKSFTIEVPYAEVTAFTFDESTYHS